MNFDRAVQIILEIEKGYSMRPTDPGGETNFGISKAAYPHLDIKNLNADDSKKILYQDYWRLLRCDELPDRIRLIVLDAAVNQGQPTAIKMLQKAVGFRGADVDGVFGPQTMDAVHRLYGQLGYEAFSILLFTERAVRYAKAKNFDEYGRGWFKRLFTIQSISRGAADDIARMV